MGVFIRHCFYRLAESVTDAPIVASIDAGREAGKTERDVEWRAEHLLGTYCGGACV